MLQKYLIKNGLKINPNVRKLIHKFNEELAFEELFRKYSKIGSVDSITTLDLVECFYRELKAVAQPHCIICGQSTRFSGWLTGWSKYCGPKCQMSDPHQLQLRQDAALNKYGVRSFLNSPESRRKQQLTKSKESYKTKIKQQIEERWATNKDEIVRKMLQSRTRNADKYWTRRHPNLAHDLERQHFHIISTSNTGRPLIIKHLSCGVEQPYNRCTRGVYLCTFCNPNPRIKFETVVLNELEKTLNINFFRNKKVGNIKIDGVYGDIGVDVNGLFWHSSAAAHAGFGKFNPLYHFERYQHAKLHGIRLIQFFEDEWISNKSTIINNLQKVISGEVFPGGRSLTADNLWANDSLLEDAGFTIMNQIPPDYMYFNKRRFGRVSKTLAIQEMKACNQWDPNLTEIENGKNAGYYQIFDAGKTEWH